MKFSLELSLWYDIDVVVVPKSIPTINAGAFWRLFLGVHISSGDDLWLSTIVSVSEIRGVARRELASTMSLCRRFREDSEVIVAIFVGRV